MGDLGDAPRRKTERHVPGTNLGRRTRPRQTVHLRTTPALPKCEIEEMVLKPQALRNWKLFTGVASAATVFHTVFRVDYGPHDHCFTGVQRWYNNKMDDFLGIGSTPPSHPDADLPPGTTAAERAERDRPVAERVTARR